MALNGRWWWAVTAYIILTVVTFGLLMLSVLIGGPPAINSLASLLLTGPFWLGISAFGLSLQARGKAPLSRLFEGFDGVKTFFVAVGAYLLVCLFVLLWSLLLIVPGIMAALSYAMTFWVLAEEPDLGPMRALSRSRSLMQGHRMQLFRLYFRVLGWYLLALLLVGGLFYLAVLGPYLELALFLGVGFFGVLWVMAYQLVSFAEFYRELQHENEAGPV